jgi:transposase
MDLHLDTLLNLSHATVEQCVQNASTVTLTLRLLNDTADCSHCGQSSGELNQSRLVRLRDLSVFGQATYLMVPRRQFYCRACQQYFTERLPYMDPGRQYTRRYEAHIYEQVQCTTIEQVSRGEGLTYDRVEGIFNHQDELKKKADWAEVKRIAIDEVSHRKGQDKFATVVGDIEAGRLLEVIDSHRQADIVDVLAQQPIAVREQIEEVSVDMWGGFPKVVETVFPNATLVIDRFHVMQATNKELDKIRRQVKISERGSKFILLRNGVDLTESQQSKLEACLERSTRLRKAYELKEELRAIYESPLTVEMGRLNFEEWLRRAQEVYSEATKTIRNHLTGICNYFRNRTTSGTMEGINNRIKLIKRQAYGFRNFGNFRKRLLACFSD